MLGLISLVLLPWSVLGGFLPSVEPRNAQYISACRAIAKVLSKHSAVYYPGNANYTIDIDHWSPASNLPSACTVEPGTTEDVSKVMKVLNRMPVPFAIKSGGHTTNLQFGSTLGVHIALRRLNQAIYHKKTNIVDLGPGQTWDQVYEKLEPHAITVAGGRITGVGVGGYLLGGGYSWISNSVGLAIDTITGFELVLPSGAIVEVSKSSHPDLFFGLKGGFNNFGIVTRFSLKAYPQGPVWGGLITFAGPQIPAVLAAVADFDANNSDPNGNLIATLVQTNKTATYAMLLYYNGTDHKGLFDPFLAINASYKDVSTRSFPEMVRVSSPPFENLGHLRLQAATASLERLSPHMLDQIANQTSFYDNEGSFGKDTLITIGIEPFMRKPIVNQDVSLTAFPHRTYVSPLLLLFGWPDASTDDAGRKAVAAATNYLIDAARKDGQNVDQMALYPNYASGSQSTKKIYGPNLPRLQALRKKYDPHGVMLRTGGFRF